MEKSTNKKKTLAQVAADKKAKAAAAAARASVISKAVSGHQSVSFMEFVREQGVVGLAIGLVLGSSVKELVDTIVKSFIDPLISIVVPNADSLATAKVTLGGKDFLWGLFLSVIIRFLSIALVVYFVAMRFAKFDKKKA
jgi:large conductance mechanosensitive channel